MLKIFSEYEIDKIVDIANIRKNKIENCRSHGLDSRSKPERLQKRQEYAILANVHMPEGQNKTRFCSTTLRPFGIDRVGFHGSGDHQAAFPVRLRQKGRCLTGHRMSN